MKKNIFFCVLIIFVLSLFFIVAIYRKKNNFRITTKDFKNTTEYRLAKAVNLQNEKFIKEFCFKDPECVKRTYEDHYYSVLHWAAETGKLKSVKALLDAGMNPNVLTENFETPLHRLPGNLTVRNYIDYSQVIILLINYGADCNYPQNLYGPGESIDTYGKTPFMNEIIYGKLNYADIMLEKGSANVNAKTRNGVTAAVYSLNNSINFPLGIYNAHYIICKCKANVKESFYLYGSLYLPYNTKLYPVELLRRIVYPLDSEEYKIKQEIIEEFKNQGIDYYAEPVPEEIKETIIQLYPDSWEDYIKVY